MHVYMYCWVAFRLQATNTDSHGNLASDQEWAGAGTMVGAVSGECIEHRQKPEWVHLAFRFIWTVMSVLGCW